MAFAEAQALRQVPMYMKDWAARLHDILTINQKEIKLDAGRISKKIADELAEKEYEKFDARRKEIEAMESVKLLEEGVKKIGKLKK
ncbi:MAG: RhuM family protein [Niabella sp.]